MPTWRCKILYVPQRPAVLPGTPREFFNLVCKFAAQRKRSKSQYPVSKIFIEFLLRIHMCRMVFLCAFYKDLKNSQFYLKIYVTFISFFN